MEPMAMKPAQTQFADSRNLGALSKLRRSKRVIVDVPLVVRGVAEDRRPFREETFTLTVSAHGGLMVLENRVVLGEKIVLMNPKTWDEREATIAFLGPPYAGLSTVGIQFNQPAPDFWAISAPPSDWAAARA
jgi:hypothetical protein